MATTVGSGTRAAGGNPTAGRWLLVAAALLVQISTGAVYAWSVFAKALRAPEAFGWSATQAALPFTVTIGVIFLGTYIGGQIQDRKGPRVVALVGGVLYSLGILAASLADTRNELWLLVLTYGVISGFGLGLAYIVPIAMLQKWFPDKRGLITGLAVGGFGFGAVIASPLAQRLIDANPSVPTRAFLPLGIGYLIATVLGAAMFKNPPAGYTVPGWSPATTGKVIASERDYTQGEALRTPQWYLLTLILFLNVSAGIALISQAASSATAIAGYTTAAASGLVGIWALFNGGGRIVWAAASDKIGRMPAFVAMLAIQGVCFVLLPSASNAVLFFILGALIYLCYGGGFGTMPATAGDFFGLKNAGAIYGLMIVGWSAGGVFGPLLAARLSSGGNYDTAYRVIGIIALVSAALPFITRRPGPKAGMAGEPAVATVDKTPSR